jgi:hypothetical protein
MPLLSAPSALAASATLSLSPASSSVTQGNILTVSIYENSDDEPVNAATATLSYPTDKLDFVSISSSSAFAIVAANSGGGGTVSIDRGALPAVTGRQLVASVRFSAKTNSGSAAVTITSGTVVSANSNSNIMSGSSGGNYTFKAPVAAAPAAPPPPKDTTPPVIKDVAVTEISYNTATVTWTTSEPASSQVDYGLNNGYGLAAGDNNFVTAHKMVLNSALLTPGTQYHFVVKSVDPAGNAVAGADKTFTTKGATLAVKVVDQKNKPVKDAKVNLGNAVGVTDKNGQTTLTGLQVGKIVGIVTYKGKQNVVTVDVKPISAKGTPQSVALSIQKQGSHLLVILLPLLTLLLLVGALVMMRKNKNAWSSLKNYLASLKPKGKGDSGSGGGTTPIKPDVGPSVSKSQSDPSVIRPTIPPRDQK